MKRWTWRSSAARRIPARSTAFVRPATVTRARGPTSAASQPSSSADLRRVEIAQRGPHVRAERHAPSSPRTRLSAAWRGNDSIRSRSAASPAAPASVGSRTTAATSSGNAEASADTAPIAPGLAAAVDQRLGADEDVEPVEEVGRERIPRAVGDLHPGDVVRLLAQAGQHRLVERVAGRRRELVDVERQRGARAGRGQQVGLLRLRVELEVRRPDHRDRVGARLRGVRRERHRVGGRLGAAVRGDESPPRDALEPELEPALPLVDREQHRLAVRPEREDAVEAGADEEVGVRAERVLVEAARRSRGAASRPRRSFRASGGHSRAKP